MLSRTHARLTAPCALLLGASASAQEPPAPGREPIEEIVITGERRDLHAQELGISVSAFSQDMLESQNIQEIHDLQYKVPSFVATSGFSQITIRGIGTDINAPSSDPGVGIHVDGVYQTPGAGLLDYFDVQQIEVLPGPQGSLGGRHTTGGSIYILTNKPTQQWEISGDAEVASYDKLRLRGVANVPLGETLAARVAAIYESPAYPLEAEPIGQHLSMNDLDGGTAVRASLLWTPADSFVASFVGTRIYLSTQGGMSRYLGDYPAYPAGQSPLFYESTPDYTLATPNPQGALRLRHDRRQKDQVFRTWTVQGNLAWDLGPVVAKSVTHYLDMDFVSDADNDSSDLDVEQGIFEAYVDTFTQELTLASDGDGRLQWLLGGMWQSERPSRWRFQQWQRQANAAAASFVALNSFDFTPYAGCGAIGVDPCVFTPLPNDFRRLLVRASVRTDVAGAFANAWLDLTDRIRIVGGVRYNRTERDLQDTSLLYFFDESLDVINDDFCLGVFGVALPAAACFDLILGAPSGGVLTPTNVAFVTPLRGDRNLFTGNTQPVRLHKAWESVTGNLRLELKPHDDALLYASFATGSRAGGFNLVEGWSGHTGFGPETNYAYELGAKATLRDQLQLSGAFYWYDYEHKHTVGVVRGFTLTTNAAQASVYGAELQFVWQASDALQLRGSLGWLSAEYASDFLSSDGSLGPDNPTAFDPTLEPGRQHGVRRPPENLTGNPLSRSPDWTLSLGGDYRLDLGARGALIARLDFAWRDAINYRQFDNPLDRQGAYTRTDLSLRWEQSEAGAVWAELYVNNLEDRCKVKTQLSNENVHRQWFLAAPRMVGFRAGWSWQSVVSPFAREAPGTD